MLGSLITELCRTQSASGGRCPAITDSPLARIAFTVGFNGAASVSNVGADKYEGADTPPMINEALRR
jgi:hypothetical protein